MSIHRGEAGYHTYYLRKQAPIRSFILPLLMLAYLNRLVLKPLRRLIALRRRHAPS